MATVTRTVGAVFWREDRQRWVGRPPRRHPHEPRPRDHYYPGPHTPEREREVRRELAQLIADTDRRVPQANSGRMTVGGWLDTWVAAQRANPAVRDTTKANREQLIRLYVKPAFGRYRLADLSVANVEAGMAEIRAMHSKAHGRVLSQGTVRACFVTLQSALTEAVRLERIPRNPCRSVTVEGSDTIVEPPTQAQLDALFRALEGHPLHPLFSVLRWTGMRVGEALGLEWDYVDVESGRIKLMRQAGGRRLKAGRPRVVLMPPAVAAELAQLKAHHVPRLDAEGRRLPDYVFVSSTGHPWDRTYVRKVWARHCRRLGLRPPANADLSAFRPHDLRHAFATVMLEAGVSTLTVANWLGHSSTRVLERTYSHVDTLPGGESYRRLVDVWGQDVFLLGLRPAGAWIHAAGVTPG